MYSNSCLGFRGRTVDVHPNSEDSAAYIPFLSRLSGDQILSTDQSLAYNPSTNTLTVGNISGQLANPASKVSINNSTYNGNLNLVFSDGDNSLLDNVHLLYNPFFQTLRIEANNGQTKHLILQNSSNSTGIQLKGQKSGVSQYETNILNYQDNFQIQNTGGSIHIQQVGNGSLLLSNDSGSITIDSSGNIQLTGSCTAQSFSGSGSGLTGLTVAASAISGLIQLNQLAESTITLGSTTLALGSTITTLTGLTSVTSNSFVGDLNGDADSAYKVSLSSISVFSYNVPDYIVFSDLSGQAAVSDKNLLKYYAGLHFNGYQRELTSPNLKLSGYATIGGALTCAGQMSIGNASDTNCLYVSSSSYATQGIRVGGWYGTYSATDHLIQASYNLHIDCASSGELFLNYYSGKDIRLGGNVHVQGDINIPRGNILNFGHNYDANWYMYQFSDNNSFRIRRGQGTGAEFTIDTAGNVGIGDGTPQSELSVINTSGSGGYTFADVAAGFFSGATTGGVHGPLLGGDYVSGNSFIQSGFNRTGFGYHLILQPNSGNVGIGTITPNYKLDVNGGVRCNTATFYEAGCYYTGSTGSGTPNAIAFKWASPYMYGRVDNVVDMVVGTVSDRRVKCNIETVTPTQARKFLDTTRATFYSSDDYVANNGKKLSCKCSKRICGGIAQELEEHFPELVHSPEDDGLKSLHVQGIVFMAISAIQEVDKENTRLKTRLDSLEQRLLRIENPPWFRGTKREREV